MSGNFEPGATRVPAPGGGGSNTATPDAVPVPRDRGLDEDGGAGISDPSADFFALLQHTINTSTSLFQYHTTTTTDRGLDDVH